MPIFSAGWMPLLAQPYAANSLRNNHWCLLLLWPTANGFLFIWCQFNEDDWNQDNHISMVAICIFVLLVNSDYRVNPVEISSQNCNVAWTKLEAERNQHSWEVSGTLIFVLYHSLQPWTLFAILLHLNFLLWKLRLTYPFKNIYI